MVERESNSAPQAPPEPVPHTLPGAGVAAFKIITGLTNEKLLLLVVICGFGWTAFASQKSNAERELYLMRSAEEAKERDRRRCDEQEEKRERRCDERVEKILAHHATESDKNRAMLKEFWGMRKNGAGD